MYCTVTDVRNALTPGAVVDDTTTASGLEDVQIMDAIAEADTVVDSHVANFYKIPVVSVPTSDEDPTLIEVAPQPVRFWSRDIAAYLATLTYKRNKDVPEDDPVRLRFRMTMDILGRVASGAYRLPFPPPEDATSGAGGVTVVNLYEGDLFSLQDFGIGPAGRHFARQDLGWNRYE